jgi:hypothetical protein
VGISNNLSNLVVGDVIGAESIGIGEEIVESFVVLVVFGFEVTHE